MMEIERAINFSYVSMIKYVIALSFVITMNVIFFIVIEKNVQITSVLNKKLE